MNPSRPPGCENCTEECTIHLTQIINNQIKKIDMCENCPNAKSIQDPNQFNLLSDLIAKPPAETLADDVLTCPNCGYTEDTLKKTGRMGCSQCYEVFEENLIPMLKNMHKGTQHIGKIPQAHHRDSLKQKIDTLQKQLEVSISEEQYEEAAQLRDEIQALKESLS